MEIEKTAKILIAAGTVIIISGVILLIFKKLPFNPGSLPGDIKIQKEGFTFYFPIVTCIILSILLTLFLRLFR